MSWPEPVERVAVFLRAAGAEARLEEFATDTPIGAGGGRRDRLRARADRQVARVRVRRRKPVLALVPGDRRADPAKVALAAGAERRARRAPAGGGRRDGLRPGWRRAVPPPRRRARPRRADDPLEPRCLGRSGLRAPHGDALAARARAADGRSYRGHRRRNPHNQQRPRTRRNVMEETEKIWMNGELVDWADAKVHVGVHGLHYGSGVFEGVRCYETPKGPAVFRLADHMQRLHDSARLLYMDIPFSVEELREATHELVRVERAARLLHPADRLLRLRPARRLHAGQPRRDRDHELALGRLPRRDRARAGHHDLRLVVEARRPEHDPARLEGERRLPQLDARDDRGAARRVRRGDPAHRRRLRRRRPRGEHLRGQERRHPHAAALDVDPARADARCRDHDRPGSRLRRRGDAADPLRPLPRRRVLHDRHGGRGDAGARGRRPGARRRPRHAGDPDAATSTPSTAATTAGRTGSTYVEATVANA